MIAHTRHSNKQLIRGRYGIGVSSARVASAKNARVYRLSIRALYGRRPRLQTTFCWPVPGLCGSVSFQACVAGLDIWRLPDWLAKYSARLFFRKCRLGSTVFVVVRKCRLGSARLFCFSENEISEMRINRSPLGKPLTLFLDRIHRFFP